MILLKPKPEIVVDIHVPAQLHPSGIWTSHQGL